MHSAGYSSFDKWARRQRATLENMVFNYIIGSEELKEGGQGEEHACAMFSNLFKKYPLLWSGILKAMGDGNNQMKAIRADVEKNVAKQIMQHLDDIAAPLYAMLDLTEEQYQKLVNIMSWEYCHDEGKFVRMRFGEGRTEMPRFMHIHDIRASTKHFMDAVGIAHGDNIAYVDPETVLIRRLKKLVEEGILHLSPNMIINVQVLRDATGI
jgi:hypothetical protein